MSSIFKRFSFWYRLKKFIAWMLRYRANLVVASVRRRFIHAVPTEKSKIDPITTEEFTNAEMEIVKNVQRESFEEELTVREKASRVILCCE